MIDSKPSDPPAAGDPGRNVVVGAGGFLGRALCEGLLDRGRAVLAIGPGVLPSHPRLVHYPHYVRDRHQVAELLKPGDIVFDAVGATTPATLSEFSEDAALNELRVHGAIVDGAVRARARKLVLVSSGGTVYGDPRSAEPINEDHPVAPRSPYAVTKVQTEEMFKAAARAGLVDAIIGRLSNPYGPGQVRRRAQGLVATVFEDLLDNRPTQIWGDGSAIRDYIFIDDARDGIINAMILPSGSIFHVSSGTGKSVRDVVSDVAAHLGRPSQVLFDRKQSAGVAYSVLSNAYLASSISWQAQVDWESGLARTAAWWLKHCG